MFRKMGAAGAAIAVVLMTVLSACGGGGHAASGADKTVSASHGQKAENSAGGSIASKPGGLPVDDPIPGDDGNNCRGQNVQADIYAHVKSPFAEGLNPTYLLKDNGAVKNTTLELRVAGDRITWQVTKADTYVCDAFVKRDGRWQRVESSPLMDYTISVHHISEVYVTAYEMALVPIGGDAAS